MSKKSRGFQPGGQPTSQGETPGDGPAAPGGRITTGSPTSRSAARRSRVASTTTQATGPARYRTLLLIGLAVAGIAIVAIFLLGGASAARYTCDSLLTPAPEPSGAVVAGPVASADPTPQLGFATRDLGRDHAATGSTLRFDFCPPTSGTHWSVAGRAPLRREVYRPGDDVSPGNWVHNLEHGYVVIAYRDELTPDQEQGIREVFDTAEPGPVAVQCGLPNKVIAVQFDDMAEPFALLAWDRAMLLSEWDTGRALAFANQWQESPQNPESSC